ncbi:MAG: hypothetical protein FWD22_04480 [Treponema sp.]|nr:hypothetical protein [Treponema sp.]
MNTIPTIFNEKITSYTAVGGKDRVAAAGISAVVLNRPGQSSRKSFFSDLEKTGFDNVISIESCAPHYEIEELSSRFPFVRFILPEKEINFGEQVNLAASEIESPLFFVIRSDMKIIAGGTARRLAERLSVVSEDKGDNEQKSGFKRLCTVPVMINSNYELLPSIVSPIVHNKKMKPFFLEPQNEGEPSLYPFDGVGIYDRQRFILTGGYDITINHTHWQLMDFGFRSHLWGEEIAVSLQLKLSYNNELPGEDFSLNDSYRRFYLKNLAPVFRGDYAHLPLYCFPPFFSRTGNDFFSAWEEFKESKKWVLKNKFRWKCDARSLINIWGSNGSKN